MNIFSRRFVAGASVLVALMLALAGCSSGGTNGTDAAGGGDLLDEIVRRGELRIGVFLQYKPLMFKNDAGEPDGFDIDIGKALAEAMGVEVVFVESSWDGIIPGLLAGKYDIVISAMARTPERALAVNFSEAYYYHSMAFAYREEDADRFENIEAFDDAAVSIIVGDASHLTMERFFPNAEISNYNTADEAMLAMQTGKTDASVASTLYVLQYVEEHDGLNIREIDLPGAALPGAIAMRPGAGGDHLVKFINLTLRHMKDTGKYDEIYSKWFPSLPVPERIGW